MPDDLVAALGVARAVWEGSPRSVKRGMLEFIKTAKKPETRAKRIADLAKDAGQSLRPRNFRYKLLRAFSAAEIVPSSR